ncbi:protein abrupt-like isoform X1 [Portunus trituberculatus]|uniref:protein abrupt-like isoform X1 n=2 Tax=Portunus trituberculatus TaxID=210409 RepID=UPI001E1CB70D|nr:protein abrupt-like isoform X1 [Portunus trituberculatus]
MMGEPRRCWLRWHNYSDSVTSALEALRYDEDFLDVTVACEGRTVRAHKLVLSACSAYFRKVLKDHPCDHPIIILDGMGWRQVVALLHFMYCGEVVVEEDHLVDLLNAASSLSVTGLSHVTSALVSSQTTQEDSDEDFEEDEEEEEELDQAQNSSESIKSKNEGESEGDSSYDSDAPPAKRQRVNTPEKSAEFKSLDESQSGRETVQPPTNQSVAMPMVLPPTITTSSTSVITTIVANGPIKQEASSATTSPAVLPTNDSSNKENEKMTGNHPDRNNKEVRSTGSKVLNGDSWIKEEVEEVTVCPEKVVEAIQSGQHENDVDSLKEAISLQEGKLSQSDGDSNSNPVAGSSNPPGPVNYISFLASEGIFPPTCSTKASTTLLLSSPGLGNTAISEGTLNMEKVVQRVLLPSLPSTGTLPTNLTQQAPGSGPCPATSNTSASQPYIHPSLVSGKEVQATLEQYQRKLAFHEPRPCPTCKRMYRDAATLRTHMAIMHAEGREPFSCSCGALFRTKYDMYQHKKNGHR